MLNSSKIFYPEHKHYLELLELFSEQFLFCCDKSKPRHQRLKIFDQLIGNESFATDIVSQFNKDKYQESYKNLNKTFSYKNFFELDHEKKLETTIYDDFAATAEEVHQKTFINSFLFCCDKSKPYHNRVSFFEKLVKLENFITTVLSPLNIKKYIEITKKPEHQSVSYENFFQLNNPQKFHQDLKISFAAKLHDVEKIEEEKFFNNFILCCNPATSKAQSREKYQEMKSDPLFFYHLDAISLTAKYRQKHQLDNTLDFKLFFDLDHKLLPRYILFRNEFYSAEIKDILEKFSDYLHPHSPEKILSIFSLRDIYNKDDKAKDSLLKELLEGQLVIESYQYQKKLSEASNSKHEPDSSIFASFFMHLSSLCDYEKNFHNNFERIDNLFAGFEICLKNDAEFDKKIFFDKLINDEFFLEFLNSALIVDIYLDYEAKYPQDKDFYKNFFALDADNILPKKYLESFQKKLLDHAAIKASPKLLSISSVTSPPNTTRALC